MAYQFFLSIPSSVAVKDPYEEVFSLFTTETSDAPWAHNRSVSQQSTRLEVELDFTPAPSPTVSQPGSRPDSRSGSYFPTAAGVTLQNDQTSASPPLEGGGAMIALRDSFSTSPSPLSHSVPGTAPGSSACLDLVPASTSLTTLPKARSPATRALLGSRKSGRNAGSGLAITAAPQQQQQQHPSKKPVVIHQSLSTLSQPGQTGTVVWDSSILMAKFMLSIKGLAMGCYRSQLQEKRAHEAKNRRIRKTQQDQIRKLEEQAEHLAVSVEGNLEAMTTEDEHEKEESAKVDAQNRSGSEDEDDEDEDKDDRDDGESQGMEDMLIFDPAETSVLELGSGCGLLGIVMAELCQDLLLTDQKPVLPLLVKNLRKNLDKKYFDQNSSSTSTSGAAGARSTATSSPSSTAAASRKGKKDRTAIEDPNTPKPCHIQVQELVWGQDLDQDLKRGLGLDYIVATDVVYNESIVPKLVHTLKELCEIRERVREECEQGYGDQFDRLQESSFDLRTGDDDEDEAARMKRGQERRMRRMNRTVVLLAQELRTDYVHLAFLEGLEQAGFRMVRMPRRMLDADYQSGYVIYAFFLKGDSGGAKA